MGVVFVEHKGGSHIYSCLKCDAYLTNKKLLCSTRFTAGSGRAYLFNKVYNIKYSNPPVHRMMLTGRHVVRDVHCKNCNTVIGWMYEFAFDKTQAYKEGKVILERSMITDSSGLASETP